MKNGRRMKRSFPVEFQRTFSRSIGMLRLCPVFRLQGLNMITAIYSLDFIHCLYILQPQRFKRWLFPRHQVNLLCWVRSIELASIGGCRTYR
jgi:hypothetical protein